MQKTSEGLETSELILSPKISWGKAKIDFLHKPNWPEMMIKKVIYFHLLNVFCEQADLWISFSENTDKIKCFIELN